MPDIRYISSSSIFDRLDRRKATALLDCRFNQSEVEVKARDALTAYFLDPDEEHRRAAIYALDRLPAGRQLALKGRAW